MRELRQNWLDVFQGFSIARDPKKWMLGLAGIIASIIAVSILVGVFSAVCWPNAWNEWVGFLSDPFGEFRPTLNAITDATIGSQLPPLMEMVKSPSQLFKLVTVVGGLGADGFFFVVLVGLALLAIWSFFGGAILRISAVQFAKDEVIDVHEATGFAWKKYWSFLSAPIVPLLGILLLAMCIGIGGVVGRIGWGIGPFIVGFFFFLALFAGFIITFAVIGGVFGMGLMLPTVATEGTDMFDAVSRAFSYILSRPWRFLWYVLVSVGYAVPCILFVYAFTWITVQIPLLVGSLTMGEEFNTIFARFLEGWSLPTTWYNSVGAVFLKMWVLLVWGLFAGYVISQGLAAKTIVYALMRKDVDGTDMTEVYVEEEEQPFEEPAAAAGTPEKDAEITAPAEEPAPAKAEDAAATPKSKRATKKRKTTAKKKTAMRRKAKSKSKPEGTEV